MAPRPPRLRALSSTPPHGLPAWGESVPPPAHLRARLLALTADPWWRALERVASLVDLPVEQVRAELANARAGGWVHWVETGVELFHFDGGPSVADADVGLLRAPPCHHFPRHRHTGREQAVVLEGEVRSGAMVLRAGGYSDLPAGTEHDWWAGPEGTVLVVVVEAPVDFTEPA